MSSPSSQRHKELYKGKAAPWKEVYRQKCMARLREKRDKELNARRNLTADDPVEESMSTDGPSSDILEVMSNEWDSFRTQGFKGTDLQDQPALRERPFMTSFVLEDIMSMFEDIKREMRDDEEKHRSQAQFEHYFKQEEEELCHIMDTLHTFQIICPMCEKYNLVQHKCMILCRCGLSINTDQDCINLKNIHDNLERATAEHSTGCEEKPTFSHSEKFGVSNLLMACEVNLFRAYKRKQQLSISAADTTGVLLTSCDYSNHATL